MNPLAVIPAALNSGAGQAGIQPFRQMGEELDPGVRRDDDKMKFGVPFRSGRPAAAWIQPLPQIGEELDPGLRRDDENRTLRRSFGSYWKT